MFNAYLRFRIAMLEKRVLALSQIPHTSGYSKSEGDRRIAVCEEKIRKLRSYIWSY